MDRVEQLDHHRWARLTAEGLKTEGEAPNPWTQDEFCGASHRADALALDPAKGDRITPGGVEEAAVALMGEHLGLFDHFQRESSGSAEFVDQSGVEWDVKSPLTPPEGQDWFFDPHHQLGKIRHDFSQGDRVLLNLSRVSDEDAVDLLELLHQELSFDEKGQLLIFLEDDVQLRRSAQMNISA